MLFNPFKRADRPDLEKLAREAIIERGIKIIDSIPNGDYVSVEINGLGDHEKDDLGALEHFKESLDRKKPTYIREIFVSTGYIGAQRKSRRKISAIGYIQTPSRSV